MKYNLSHLLLEYSEKVYKTLIDRFKLQNKNLDEEQIAYYITRFAQLLPSMQQRFKAKDEAIMLLIPKYLQEKNKFTDILQWRLFTEIEKIVDSYPASKKQQKVAIKQQVNDAETDADEIFNDGTVEVYKGDTMSRCIKYGINEKYSWCISRAGDTRSMYYNYRFQGTSSRSFYFVFDRSRPSNKQGSSFVDNFHAFVIHTFEKGTYAVTSADNGGDQTAESWEGLARYIPAPLWARIKGLKNIIAYVPPSNSEVELQALKNKTLTKEQFLQLSHQTKVQYIQNNAKDLDTHIFKSLDVELKNMAINFDRKCSFDEIKMNTSLLKRYPDLRFKHFNDEAIPYPFIPYLKEELQRLYYEKFEAEFLTFDEIEKYFHHNILLEYIDKQVNKLGFLPSSISMLYSTDAAEKHMTPDQKALFDVYRIASMDIEYFQHNSNEETDRSAPARIAQIPDLSKKTFETLPKETRTKFINFFKKLGSTNSEKKSSQYNEFLIGIPVSFLINDKLYFIMPEHKGSNTKNIISEDGQVIMDNIENIKFLKNRKPLLEHPEIQKVLGTSTVYLTERDFDTFQITDTNNKSKDIPLSMFQQQLNESEYTVNKLKRAAGIIK